MILSLDMVHFLIFLTLMSLQANRVRFEFHKGAADHTFMRIDGEPWKQPLPVDDDTVIIEISHQGQVNMLAIEDCVSKSTGDPSIPPSPSHRDAESSEEEDDMDADEWKKFGAADPLKIPEDVGISRVS